MKKALHVVFLVLFVALIKVSAKLIAYINRLHENLLFFTT